MLAVTLTCAPVTEIGSTLRLDCQSLMGIATRDTKLEIVSGDAAQMLARAGGLGGWLRQAKQIAAS